MPLQVAILSYGTGNIASLDDAFAAIGASAYLARTSADLQRADALVLPGVGHFGAAMAHLNASGLRDALLACIASGLPTLGICLGFQLLTRASEEAPGETGLGLLPMHTERLRPADTRRFKVPHLGWNSIAAASSESRLLHGIPTAQQLFYYANAYGIAATSEEGGGARATYHHDRPWLALVEQDNLCGVQFHPEKSRGQGLQLLRNFLEVRPAC